MQNMPPGPMGFLFFLLWFVIMVGFFVSYVVALIALWRAMKAHESIGESIKEIARNIEAQTLARK